MKTSRTETRMGSMRLTAAAVGAALSVVSASQSLAQVTPIVPTTPDTQGTITDARIKAQKIFQALTAVRVPIDDSRVVQMEAKIAAGDLRGAAAVATADPLFYDVLLRDLAKRMSTREETVRAPISDFVTTFVGVVRDSDTVSAKELLTGNFIYQANAAAITANTIRSTDADIVQSNNHFADIESKGLSLKAILEKNAGQKAVIGGVVAAHPDPAGLITTRSFTGAHAIAGTNRRMVQYSMIEFMCVQMPDWADANQPDDRVARDVTRLPGGSAATYASTCKACHAAMDGFRGAFAFLDFPTNNNSGQTFTTTVVGKMNRNQTEFPAGFVTTDNSIINYATGTKNMDQLGWRSSMTGSGIAGFGKMLADSRGYSRCMVRQAFRSVCRRSPIAQEENLVRSLADQFEADGYHMRRMFENVAIQQQCVQ